MGKKSVHIRYCDQAAGFQDNRGSHGPAMQRKEKHPDERDELEVDLKGRKGSAKSKGLPWLLFAEQREGEIQSTPLAPLRRGGCHPFFHVGLFFFEPQDQQVTRCQATANTISLLGV